MSKKHPNGIDASGQRVINVAAPTAGSDAATKAYVDGLAGGGSGGGLTAAQARTIARRGAIIYSLR